jgi:hypothetical protein
MKFALITMFLAFGWFFVVPSMCKPNDWLCRFYLSAFVAVGCAWTFEDIAIKYGLTAWLGI